MTQTIGGLADISYDDLYERWEQGNWSATAIDFTEDRRQWHESLDETQRRAALWNYALFFHGEDAVTDALGAYIDAAPREEQKYFLATQQVDEARHSVFFGRFMREVIERGTSFGDSLEATESQLTWGFRRVFARLEQTSRELRRDRSRPRLAAALALYHLLIEGTLAQPGQHFIEDYLERNDLLPGFRAGIRNVSLDEQRHIGFGVKLLAELCAEDAECRSAVLAQLQETNREMVAVFVPPGFDRSYTECFGFSLEDIYTEAVRSLRTKLRTIGFDEMEIQRVVGMRLELEPEQIAERALKLLEAGVLGEKNGPPASDEEVMRLTFDIVESSVVPAEAPGGTTTIQWEFADAEPWLLRIDGAGATAEPGRAARADLTFRCRWEDWVDVLSGRSDPRLAMLRGRLRPRGSMRVLLRMPRMLPRA